VGDRKLIESMKAKTYSSDIYSPRVPQPSFEAKDIQTIKPELNKIDASLKEYNL